ARFAEVTISSIGAHLTIAVSNIFFLGIPVMYAMGAYAMVVPQKYGLSLPWSLVIALIVVLLTSLIFVLTYLKVSRDSFTVFTLTSILAFDALLKSWDSVTGGVLGISGVVRPGFVSSLRELAWFQFGIMIILLLAEYIILKTRFGRALLGMKENSYVIESFGLSTKLLGSLVIIISSVFAAIAGILTIWRIQFLDPSFGGILLLIQIATVAIIAAKPKIRWLSGATLFVVLLPEVLRFFALPSTMVGHLRNLIYSVLLIIILKTISKNLLPRKRFI
ncbi:MAG: branched-chain amino acid ABC transporter permease, partial [bacterium]